MTSPTTAHQIHQETIPATIATHLHRITLGELSARSGGVVTAPCQGGDLARHGRGGGHVLSPWGLSLVAVLLWPRKGERFTRLACGGPGHLSLVGKASPIVAAVCPGHLSRSAPGGSVLVDGLGGLVVVVCWPWQCGPGAGRLDGSEGPASSLGAGGHSTHDSPRSVW